MKRNGYLSVFCTCLLAAPALMATPLSVHAKSIGKDQVNIRSGPSTNNSVVFEAPLGYPIEIKKQEGKWVYFQDWENNNGWVYKSLVSDTKTAVILVETANIRSSASTRSSIVAKAEIGEIYKVLGTKNNWVRLGYYHGGSPLGWIRGDLVFGE